MLRISKITSALALGVALSAACVMPAQALSIIRPATPSQETAQPASPASAFAAAKGEESGANPYALSPQEISHIQWCAARYGSYHPIDNSYLASTGSRVQCRSPY